MFKFRILAIFVLFSSYLVLGVKAGYTSDEEDERRSKDTSKHHHKHAYDSPPPCATGRCPRNVVPAYVGGVGSVAGVVPPPCGKPSGCPVLMIPVYGHGVAHTGGVYGQSGYTGGYGYGAYPPPPQQSLPVYPQPSGPSTSYISGYGNQGSAGAGGYATVLVSGPPSAAAEGYAYHQPAILQQDNNGYSYDSGSRGCTVKYV